LSPSQLLLVLEFQTSVFTLCFILLLLSFYEVLNCWKFIENISWNCGVTKWMNEGYLLVKLLELPPKCKQT
jgi:hypothetical protein